MSFSIRLRCKIDEYLKENNAEMKRAREREWAKINTKYVTRETQQSSENKENPKICTKEIQMIILCVFSPFSSLSVLCRSPAIFHIFFALLHLKMCIIPCWRLSCLLWIEAIFTNVSTAKTEEKTEWKNLHQMRKKSKWIHGSLLLSCFKNRR